MSNKPKCNVEKAITCSSANEEAGQCYLTGSELETLWLPGRVYAFAPCTCAQASETEAGLRYLTLDTALLPSLIPHKYLNE